MSAPTLPDRDWLLSHGYNSPRRRRAFKACPLEVSSTIGSTTGPTVGRYACPKATVKISEDAHVEKHIKSPSMQNMSTEFLYMSLSEVPKDGFKEAFLSAPGRRQETLDLRLSEDFARVDSVANSMKSVGRMRWRSSKTKPVSSKSTNELATDTTIPSSVKKGSVPAMDVEQRSLRGWRKTWSH
ncbi:hypothetical protein QBC43DRAFT_335913 [Cladorrhinum sp. PSN259]|nr:hypothetical protein QBC43DRAFT_335913 [Cladorrhinum sp. PSN259]